MLLEKLRTEAQSALEKLWAEELLPFELEARKIDYLGYGEYKVRFCDGRLHSVDVSWKSGDCFEDLVRVAVLARVEGIDAPPPPSVALKKFSRHAA